MRVLGYIHTLNDADVISGTIDALRQQTRHVDEILLVDNASTDGTLAQPSVNLVSVLCHAENLGASGALCSGFRYALEHGFDWIWTFDPDCRPEPDALEKLLELYTSWPQSEQEETAFIACLHHSIPDGENLRTCLFTRYGLARANPAPEERYYRCHVTTWSGCLYRLAAVRHIGLPNPDYFADWGEAEYGYRVMKAGYKGFTYLDAVHHHDVRGYASSRPVEITRGGVTRKVLEFPPLRCYYSARNRLYLALYDFAEFRPWMILRVCVGLVTMMLKLLRAPGRHGTQLRAYFRGIWHGITGNISARY
jgi:GT2 family glycosyltransferase